MYLVRDEAMRGPDTILRNDAGQGKRRGYRVYTLAMKRVVHRYPLLGKVDAPADLRSIAVAKLPTLASELRAFLLHTINSPGGATGAALGSVELAIAVHYVFDTPADRIVWDGAEEAYAHKVLTGRRDRLRTIGEPGGLEPRPHRHESEYDVYGVGHPGGAIGAALGMASAALQRGDQRHAVAIISARTLTAGMAFEALNHAGSLPTNLLVILNDTDTPMSGTSGVLANQFGRVLSGRMYAQLREQGKKILRPIPTVLELARRSEEHLKGMVLPSAQFEELNFNYVGPVDGRNVRALVTALRNLKDRPGQQLLHVTASNKRNAARGGANGARKRAGAAAWSEARPTQGERRSYGDVLGRWLCDVAETDARIVAIATESAQDSGLTDFAARFPRRFFDLGIAHQHAVTFAAGLATEGLRPVLAIDSTFLQRTYDQLIHDIALQKLPVVLAVDGAGFVGGEGATHQGNYDLSYLRCVPNLTVMTPADEQECRQLLSTAIMAPGPAVVRYPRTHVTRSAPAVSMTAVPLGRAQVRRQGNSGLALLVFGTLLDTARLVAERLDATLVNMRFVKPLDCELLRTIASSHRALVTIEENALVAGAGSAVGEAVSALGLEIPLLQIGIPDRFLEHGSRESSLAAAGLDAVGLRDRIEQWWLLQGPEQLRSAVVGQ
jgi:1-deoxy-D-xylulose-5-phosphate synthase